MMHSLKQRIFLTLAATLLGVGCGVALGYLLGRTVVIRLTEKKLMQHATAILVEEETYSAESRVMLAKANASPYPWCSDAEIAWFRMLVFQSQYLQEVGHMRDGRIECSAILGRDGLSQERFKPNFSRWDGSKIYLDIAPLKNDRLPITAVQMGDSFIVYNPYNTRMFDAPPMHYTIKLFAAPDRQSSQFAGGATWVDASVPATDGLYRLHDSHYVVRCSKRFFNCVTTYISTQEVLQSNHGALNLSSGLGGIIGACFGFLASFLYRRSRSMEQQLRRAIARDELQLVYQPIVNLASRRIVGAEALARWTDEEGFAIGPDVFVHIAEERGFVCDITRLVVRKSLRDLGETLRSHPDFRININVAAADLADPGFVPMLDNAIEEAGIQAQSLAIEITEGSTANQHPAMETIRQLRDKHYGVHIDDFGTGYSSLSYLHDLSVDAIKIDRSFTQAIGTQAVTVGILPQILKMAEALHLEVIVEGVETSLQANYFAGSSQPVLAQGWLFGRPIAPADFQALLANDEKKPTLVDSAA